MATLEPFEISSQNFHWSRSPPRPFLAVPNVTANPSTASVPTSYYSITIIAFGVYRVNGSYVLVIYTTREELSSRVMCFVGYNDA